LMETNCFRGTQEINNLYAEKLVAIEVLALKNLKEINKINAPNLILTNNVPNCIKEKLNEQTM
ncbi:MAG: hypothetical protein IKA31_01035, partial [Clostridia bacterium]|nr:hypothetical protein [Clostridia bacterium]